MSGDTRPKIAFVHSSLKFGGAERVTLNLAHALTKMGYEIDILLMSAEGELLQEARDHFNVVDLDCSKTWKLPGRLASYLRRTRPVALVPSFWKLNLCACIARLSAPRTRLGLWEHSPPSRVAHTPTRLYVLTASIFYRVSTVIIAVSDGVAADIRRLTVGLRRKLVTVYNAIPAPEGVSIRELPNPFRRKIIWVGRLADPKNPGLMVEAFARLPTGEGYQLTFLGDGVERKQLEKKVEELNLCDRVRFIGFRPDPYSHIAEADILVLSSDREGLPTVLIEGMNVGLNVVSTDCCEGVREILQDGVYGTIVPVNDPAALAAGIVEEAGLARDPTTQKRGAERFEPARVAASFVAALGLPAAGPYSRSRVFQTGR